MLVTANDMAPRHDGASAGMHGPHAAYPVLRVVGWRGFYEHLHGPPPLGPARDPPGLGRPARGCCLRAVSMEESLTCAAARQACKVAGHCVTQGVGPGHAVAVLLPNVEVLRGPP